MTVAGAACGCGAAAAGDCLCPATPLAKVIGKRYALGLLSLVANRGTVRFSELRSQLGDVSTSTLAARLSDLEEAGLISRRVFPETPPRVEYSLITVPSRSRTARRGTSRRSSEPP